jgi:hypothetical protein
MTQQRLGCHDDQRLPERKSNLESIKINLGSVLYGQESNFAKLSAKIFGTKMGSFVFEHKIKGQCQNVERPNVEQPNVECYKSDRMSSNQTSFTTLVPTALFRTLI